MLIEGKKNAAKNAGKAAPDWKTQFQWSDHVDTLLTDTFHLPGFRSVQQEVINAALSNRDVFVVMRSCCGKSLCYQFPALLHGNIGFTVVISPLISLIQDQVMLFNDIAGEGAACQLSGEQSRAEASAIYKLLLTVDSKLRILLITPEKLIKSKLLMSGQWGHDFRSDYSKLEILKRQFPTVPVLALTATATPR
ncbi:unnamed protein product [Peronospora belbahrii]|uniref:DNA 3'-5' helicase n=1 Tax=Peronospora belbahrii TaxID=622444 RepID=A0AAU9L161_9STRA|nr:unnamed protein product [Peronospora belbahrii]CAH0478454.1 unnamed protein product [Peronospora belbahrii]